MGTHVVAARAMQPVQWALRKPQNCCYIGCLVTVESFSHFDFFRNPSVAHRMGLGDHLVTIQVFEHPWGPT